MYAFRKTEVELPPFNSTLLHPQYTIFTYFRPIAKFPNPKTAAFSRLTLVFATVPGQTWQYLENLYAQYGPIVYIAPDKITTIRSGAWKNIYASKPILPKDLSSQTPPINWADSLFTAVGYTYVRM